MNVSVIIVNWNGEEKLKRFLPEVLKIKDVLEFIVTDDASTDNSVKLIKENFPEVRLIERQKNGGFSSNVNAGVKEAKGDLIFLLNPDALPDKDCITKALPYFKDPKLFSVGCNTGGNWSWAKWEKGFFWHYMASGEKMTHETMWARGGSGIFRRDIFNQLGGMDELFNPFYEEDMDLGYRAIKRGFKNIWVKECLVTLPSEKGVIEQNVSKITLSKIAQRNQLIFIWKNIHDEKMLKEHKTALFKMLILSPRYWSIFLSAYNNFKEISMKRETERKSSKVSDKEILEKVFGTI